MGKSLSAIGGMRVVGGREGCVTASAVILIASGFSWMLIPSGRRDFVNVLKLRSRASMPKATDPPEDLKTVVRRNALRITDAGFNDNCKRLTAAIKRDSRDSLSVAMFVVLASILLVGSIWFAVAKFNFSGRHAALATPTPSPTATPTTEFTPASTVRPLFFRDAVFYKKCGWNVYQSRHY